MKTVGHPLPRSCEGGYQCCCHENVSCSHWGLPPGCFRELRSKRTQHQSRQAAEVVDATKGDARDSRRCKRVDSECSESRARISAAADLAAWRRSHGIKSTSERIEWIDRPLELLVAVDRQIRGRHALALALDDRRGDRLEPRAGSGCATSASGTSSRSARCRSGEDHEVEGLVRALGDDDSARPVSSTALRPRIRLHARVHRPRNTISPSVMVRTLPVTQIGRALSPMSGMSVLRRARASRSRRRPLRPSSPRLRIADRAMAMSSEPCFRISSTTSSHPAHRRAAVVAVIDEQYGPRRACVADALRFGDRLGERFRAKHVFGGADPTRS